VDLFREGKLPQKGFIRQEEVALPDFLANRFGSAYQQSRQVEIIVKNAAMKQQTLSVLDAWASTCRPRDLTVRSPIDGSVLAQLPTSAADMKAAIGRAHEAFKAWRVVPAPKRGELVRLFGEELRATRPLARWSRSRPARSRAKAWAKCRR
jgi:hypothetical protein